MAQYVLMTIISLGVYFVIPSNATSFASKDGRKSHVALKTKIKCPDRWNSEVGDQGWTGGNK